MQSKHEEMWWNVMKHEMHWRHVRESEMWWLREVWESSVQSAQV
jgi:hypothetical protein